MKRTDAQWQKLYTNYKIKWEAWDKKLPNGMADKMYSYLGFRNAYAGLENIREAEKAAGKRKVLNTQRDLLNAQKYRYSIDQARAVQKALINKEVQNELKKPDYDNYSEKQFKALKNKLIKDFKKEFKVNEIRTNPKYMDDIYEKAKARNKELASKKYYEYDENGNLIEKQLFSGKDRYKIIKQEIFGSK